MERRDFFQKLCAALLISPVVAKVVKAEPKVISTTAVRTSQSLSLSEYAAKARANYVWTLPIDVVFHHELYGDTSFIAWHKQKNQYIMATMNIPAYYFKYIKSFEHNAVPIEVIKDRFDTFKQ